MAAFTIQELVERAADQADMEGNFVEPTTWLQWYRNEARSLDLFTLRSGYTQVRPTSEPADGQYTFSLPDAKAVLGVYETRNGLFRRLKYQPPADFYVMDLGAASRPRGEALYYTVENTNGGVNIVLNPLPTTGSYVALYHLDVGASITALTDVVNWPLGFEERVVLGMAIRAAVKEDSDTTALEKLYKSESDRIEELCFGMNYGDAARIRNVDNQDRGWSKSMVYGPWDSWLWL